MNLNDLLNYQKSDMRIKQIYAELDKGGEKKQMDSLKAAFSEAKKKMLSSEAHADKILSAYNEAVAQLVELEKKAEQLVASAEAAEDKNAVLAELEEVKKSLAAVAQRVTKLKEESDKAIKLYALAQREGKKHKEDYNAVAKSYEDKKSAVKDELNKLESEVGCLRSKVDKCLLEQYDALVAQNIRNPFVELMGDDKNYMCGGCFMAISQSLIDAITHQGYCHCDSCKRILYKRQK